MFSETYRCLGSIKVLDTGIATLLQAWKKRTSLKPIILALRIKNYFKNMIMWHWKKPSELKHFQLLMLCVLMLKRMQLHWKFHRIDSLVVILWPQFLGIFLLSFVAYHIFCFISSCLPLRLPFCPYMVSFKNRAHSIYGGSEREERIVEERVTFDEKVLLICGEQMIPRVNNNNLTRHDKSSTPVLKPRC